MNRLSWDTNTIVVHDYSLGKDIVIKIQDIWKFMLKGKNRWVTGEIVEVIMKESNPNLWKVKVKSIKTGNIFTVPVFYFFNGYKVN